MNVALSELPDFAALPGRACAEHHASGIIIIAPSLAYMEQAYFDARSFGWSRRPVIELVIPSTIDELARAARTTRCKPVLPACRPATARRFVMGIHRETVADLMINTVDNYAPNFRRSVLARQILSPLDLERTFGLIGGDISTERLI